MDRSTVVSISRLLGRSRNCLLGRRLPDILNQVPGKKSHISRRWNVRNPSSHRQGHNHWVQKHHYIHWQSASSQESYRYILPSTRDRKNSIAVARALRSHFAENPDGSLHFWDCPTDARWFIHDKVYDEATKSKFPIEEWIRESYDAVFQDNSKARMSEWTKEEEQPRLQFPQTLTLTNDVTNRSLCHSVW